MAITMIDPFNVVKMVICVRLFNSKLEEKSILLKVGTFDFENHKLLEQIEEDYNLIRQTIITQGFDKLSGSMGVYIQPRTKGTGHGSTSRAFYMRTILIKEIIGNL